VAGPRLTPSRPAARTRASGSVRARHLFDLIGSASARHEGWARLGRARARASGQAVDAELAGLGFVHRCTEVVSCRITPVWPTDRCPSAVNLGRGEGAGERASATANHPKILTQE
jgi:hypothetical protein